MFAPVFAPGRRRLLLFVPFLAFVLSCAGAGADPAGPRGGPGGTRLGVQRLTPAASRGFTLVAPEQSTWTYLVDRRGREVHRWASSAPPGQSTELLPSGLLLRAEELQVDGAFPGGKGRGGVVELLTWDGRSAWRFEYASRQHQLHHDLEALPNGNVLMIAWERKSADEARAAGRDPDLLGAALWPDHVIEVDPDTNEIVWEWHVWDHLVQDRDPTKPNFGVPSDHPGRIDVNYTLGGKGGADWNHTNSVTYNAERDEIVLSVRQFSEIWVIDHGTTTEEARGPAGDLRFRWGNPQTYGRGTARDQTLFVQHDARWTTDASGRLAFTVFDNGAPDVRQFSTVDEVVPTLVDGDYVLDAQGRFAAEERQLYPVGAADEFYAPNTSGAMRLANGNVLVTDAPAGRIIEVTPGGETVWDYVNPYFTGDADRVIRTGAGFRVAPWRLFKAEHYEASYPGLGELDQ